LTRIVFSSDIFEVQRYGGISRYFVELANEFQQMEGLDVKVSAGIHINSNLKHSTINSGLYLPFSPSRFNLGGLIQFFNQKTAKSISSRIPFDIRHETFYQGGVVSLSAKKTITTIYDLTREKFSPGWHGFVAKQKALNRADGVICISNSTATDLQNFYKVEPQKINVIHLGVSDFFSQSTNSRFRNQQLLYVGSRSGYKDFISLVKAFSNSRFLRENFRVLVFGNRFTKNEEIFMRSQKVRHNFHQATGSDAHLIKAYRESIALVITSQYEGFGLPVLEAMMSGCIVISTRGGSLKEVAGGFDIPFEFSNSESLADAITSAARHAFFDEDFKKNASNYAKQFSWHKTALKTIRVYDRTLGLD
jgi:glycosyltransferase involved in cell wall biosynthesis